MVSSHLRIFRPDDAVSQECETPAGKQVRVRLQDLLPLLADAYRNRRTWLGDFSDDEITVSSDLYEVLLAYKFCCRPSA